MEKRIRWVNIHAHHQSPGELVLLDCPLDSIPRGSHAGISCSAGIHPWKAGKPGEEINNELLLLEQAAAMPVVAAIGEAGIDNSSDIPMELQENLFVSQAELAQRMKKPMIIHCVRAYPEIIRLRKIYPSSPPWIIHGFNGNAQTAEQLLRHDIYISFGIAVLDPHKKLLTAMNLVPLQRLFLETDTSRIRVSEIYRAFAGHTGTEVDLLRRQVHENFNTVFSAGRQD